MRDVQIKNGIRMIFLVTTILIASAPALAHKVNIFAWVEAGQVHTESKFSGGKRVSGGKIEVFDHNNSMLLEGTTDEKGYFAFPVPADAQTLEIVLIAGMGHTNHWRVSAQELGTEASDTQTNALKPSDDAVPSNKPMAGTATDLNAIEQIVDKALDKKLAPIRAQLAEKSWGLRDIMGGLGYILGLVGLASYLNFRKQQGRKKES